MEDSIALPNEHVVAMCTSCMELFLEELRRALKKVLEMIDEFEDEYHDS